MKGESRGAGGDVGSAWVPIVPFLRGGRAPGEAMAPMCEQGFGPPAGSPPAPPRGRKAGKGVPGGCRWKWTVNTARWRTTEPEVDCGAPIGSDMTGAREMWRRRENRYRYILLHRNKTKQKKSAVEWECMRKAISQKRAVYLMRLPKISHAEMQRMSFPM
jgi:hypothetical protein